MQVDRFDNFIEYCLEGLCKMLKVEVLWDYAVVSPDTPLSLINKILMAYDKASNAVIINPKINDVLKRNYGNNPEYILATIYSKLAHEVRHAWQYKNKIYNFKDYVPFANVGENYILEPEEIDAYAFEEANLKLFLSDKSIEIEFEKQVPELHKKANILFKDYRESFNNIFLR